MFGGKTTQSYVIVGMGGLSKPIREILGDADFRGYYDDRVVDDAKWLGSVADAVDGPGSLFVAIAACRNMLLRRSLLDLYSELGRLEINAVSTAAYVAPSAQLGQSVVVCPLVTLHSNVKLGDGCVIFSNTAVEHNAELGRNVNVAPGVTIAGAVSIGNDCFIGAGATLIDGVSVGAGTVIGAGSLVLKSLPAGVIAYGNPARVVRVNNLYRPVSSS
jgi:UDP-perosamine 4-acetyltransferase